jgi:hypothetical protein
MNAVRYGHHDAHSHALLSYILSAYRQNAPPSAAGHGITSAGVIWSPRIGSEECHSYIVTSHNPLRYLKRCVSRYAVALFATVHSALHAALCARSNLIGLSNAIRCGSVVLLVGA